MSHKVFRWFCESDLRRGPAVVSALQRHDGEHEAFEHALQARRAELRVPRRVLLHDGLVREAERTHPLGSPGRPLDETAEAIAAKYKDGAGRTPGLADDPTVLPEGPVRAAFRGE